MTRLKSYLSLIARYPLAVVGTIVVVILGFLAWRFGFKFQIGGILEWLWNKRKTLTDNVVLVKHDDDKENVVEPGKPDDLGYVKPSIEIKIQEPGLFTNPDVIVVQHPTKGEMIFPLPTGIKNTDVKSIIEISPSVYQIANEDSGIDAKKVIDSLR